VSGAILLLPHTPSWHGHGETLILHNKQIPWNMSDIENVATDDTEYICIYTHELNSHFWTENWQKAFRK